MADEGLGAALGLSFPARFLSPGRLSGRLLFALGRLSDLPAAGFGAAATGPLGAATDGREAVLDEGFGLVFESGFLAIFDEGFGALEGPFALLLLLLLFEGLADGWAAGRGAGTEETLGPVDAGVLWRATGRASGFRLLLLLAAGRWGARLGELTCRWLELGGFGACRCTTLGWREGADRFTVGRLGADR